MGIPTVVTVKGIEKEIIEFKNLGIQKFAVLICQDLEQNPMVSKLQELRSDHMTVTLRL
ncbi:MAG: hypothetical protein JRJ77_12070 [Deltaproteobacteria bacterium]|nr:hypothetical protein [Deltaproteobacteria bacterium]